jgi:hypothetical protein
MPGPIYWLWAMADSEIPNKLLPAIRLAVFWIAVPFIALLTAFDRYFSGTTYEVAACVFLAFVSIMVAVYWDKMILLRFRAKPQRLEYLHYKDSELGSAIRDMAWCSAWARWYAAQHLFNSEKPITEGDLLQIAAHNVMENLVDKDEILKLSGWRASWQLQLLRFGVASD